MRLPDGSVLLHGELEHRAPYDARKAHDYYLRTRKLTGREKGSKPVTDLGSHVVSIRGFNAPTTKKQPKHDQATKQYMSDVSKRLKQITHDLEVKMRDAHQKSIKMPTNKEGAKKEEPVKTADELRTQISNLKGRLTSAIDRLEKLEPPAP